MLEPALEPQGCRRNRCGRDRWRLDGEPHYASKSLDYHSVVGPVDCVSGMETRLTVDPAQRRKKHEERIRSHELESKTRDYLRRADFCGVRFVDGHNEPALFEHVDLFSVPPSSSFGYLAN